MFYDVIFPSTAYGRHFHSLLRCGDETFPARTCIYSTDGLREGMLDIAAGDTGIKPQRKPSSFHKQ
jgi:hypothetical protein